MGAFARLEINPAVMFDEMIYVVTYGLFMVYLCTYIFMSYVYIIYGLKVFNRTYPTL